MFHVIDLKSGRIIRSFTYRGWAERNAERLCAGLESRHKRGEIVVMSSEEYATRREEIDPMVEVINMMSGRPVKIRKSERGTCCDPSTETYWSM